MEGDPLGPSGAAHEGKGGGVQHIVLPRAKVLDEALPKPGAIRGGGEARGAPRSGPQRQLSAA